MKIRHVVVLMMENRSFDHMLGYLKYSDPASAVNGLTGTESNPVPHPPGGTQPVGWQAEYYTKIDPGHEYDDVVLQLFGTQTVPSPPISLNNGFVASLAQKARSVEKGRTAMECFDRHRLPSLYALAEEFAVCDNWFSSVPGPTWPNRFFVHAASSNGYVENKILGAVSGRYDQPVIYDHLPAKGLDWRIYFSDIAQSLALKRLQTLANRRRFRKIAHFESDALNGRLPAYTFIEPRYFDFLSWKATDQHPGNHVELGDHLIARVYEAVRNSPAWGETLLVIIYDEHGGLYDHVPPPYDGAVVNGRPVVLKAPGGKVSKKPPFAFDRLGPRVPAVLVSPYVTRGTVDHTVYEHSSVPATVRKIFGVDPHLNERQRDANTFETILASSFRDDTPERLPRPVTDAKVDAYGERVLEEPDEATLESYSRHGASGAGLAEEDDPEPLSDFQKDLLELAYSLDGGAISLLAPLRARLLPTTETEAAATVRAHVASFLARGETRAPGTRGGESGQGGATTPAGA